MIVIINDDNSMYEQAKNTILAYNDNSQDYIENTLYAKAYSILRYT